LKYKIPTLKINISLEISDIVPLSPIILSTKRATLSPVDRTSAKMTLTKKDQRK
jgi:hypothetical protein